MSLYSEDQRGNIRESWIVAAVAACASIVAFVFYFRRGEIMLYGDAVAHINIARRIFDAQDPGISQIGTVWLPLPHLLQAPFIVNDWLWRTGIGASIPSMIAYVFGVVGVYRLMLVRTTRYTAWVAAAIYGLNPSLLYMQSTAMTESIFLAAMIWAVLYAGEFRRALFPPQPGYGTPATISAWRALERCGLCLAAAILTRYDGWVLAFVIGIVNVVVLMRWMRTHPERTQWRRVMRSAASFLLLCALTPALWLAHNYYTTGRPLDWFNGPYSAKAIEARTSHAGDPPYPGKNSMKVATQYFLKCARMTMAEGATEKWIFAAVILGAIIAASHLGHLGTLLLLWIPLPFYAYSVAYGSVPIFIPVWWPFSYYNVRYGLELLPAMAIMISIAVWSLSGIRHHRWGAVLSAALVALVAVGYVSSWTGNSFKPGGVVSPQRGPICLREGLVNSRTRIPLERWLAAQLRLMPPGSKVMMVTSQYVGALQQAGIPLERVVSESTFMMWDAAQSNPAELVDYVVAVDHDAVAEAVRFHPKRLEVVTEYEAADAPHVTVYRKKVDVVLGAD